MNEHVARYFQAGLPEAGSFHQVIELHERPELELSQASELCPALPRGWFELAQLTPEERIEFVRGYWGSTLPYIPHVNEGIDAFFAGLEDIGIFLTQKREEDALQPQLVYALANDAGFYHGFVPATEEELAEFQEAMGKLQLPGDYLAFLRVHNGFAKVTDTGVTPCQLVPDATAAFRRMLLEEPPLTWANGEGVNVECLIPFYQSFGMDSYQCFCADWYPEQEMGNLYYSGAEHTISDYRARGAGPDTMAFPTFLDWLVFYLEAAVVE